MTRINRFNGASIRKGLGGKLSDPGLVQRIFQPLTGLSPFEYLGGLPSLVLCPLSRIEEDGNDCWRGRSSPVMGAINDPVDVKYIASDEPNCEAGPASLLRMG